MSENNKKSIDIKAFAKKNKIALICVGAVALIGILAIIINIASTAYLKPYEKKYGITYPKGIAEEFCDAYGQNKNVSAKITFGDGQLGEVFILNSDYQSGDHFDEGSAIDDDAQIKSISIESSSADIEGLYSKSKNYINSTQAVYLTDIYGKSKTYQIIAAYYTNTNPSDDNGYAFPYNACGTLTEDSFNSYEDRVMSRALYHTGYDMSYTDKYLSISADSDFMQGFRFVILGVEVEKRVAPYKEVTENERVHYPQVWYDENNEHNPYWLAGQWRPVIYTDKAHKVSRYLF